jgi:hypothetical protein
LYVYDGHLFGQNEGNIINGRNYTSPIVDNSTIEVIYNKQNHQISFKVKDKDCGVAFSNVNGDLFPAVELIDMHTSVALL